MSIQKYSLLLLVNEKNRLKRRTYAEKKSVTLQVPLYGYTLLLLLL